MGPTPAHSQTQPGLISAGPGPLASGLLRIVLYHENPFLEWSVLCPHFMSTLQVLCPVSPTPLYPMPAWRHPFLTVTDTQTDKRVDRQGL